MAACTLLWWKSGTVRTPLRPPGCRRAASGRPRADPGRPCRGDHRSRCRTAGSARVADYLDRWSRSLPFPAPYYPRRARLPSLPDTHGPVRRTHRRPPRSSSIRLGGSVTGDPRPCRRRPRYTGVRLLRPRPAPKASRRARPHPGRVHLPWLRTMGGPARTLTNPTPNDAAHKGPPPPAATQRRPQRGTDPAQQRPEPDGVLLHRPRLHNWKPRHRIPRAAPRSGRLRPGLRVVLLWHDSHLPNEGGVHQTRDGSGSPGPMMRPGLNPERELEQTRPGPLLL